MDLRTFVAGEADVADLARLLRLLEDIDDIAGTEGLRGIARADDFVDLEQVDVVGFEAAKGVFELLLCGGGGAAVDLGHEEGFLPVAILERKTHAALAFAIVVVPAVVEEVDAGIESGADDTYALLLRDVGAADMVTAEADDGDGLAGAAEGAARNLAGSGNGFFTQRHEGGNGGGRLQEIASLHHQHL